MTIMVLEGPSTATEEEIFDNEGSDNTDASSESPMSSGDSGISDGIGENDTIVTLTYKPYHVKESSNEPSKGSLRKVWDKEESGRESGIDSDGSECPLDKQSSPTNPKTSEGDLTSLESMDSECSEVTLVTNLENSVWVSLPKSKSNPDSITACLEEVGVFDPSAITPEVEDLIHSDSECTSIETSNLSVNSLNLDTISNETLVAETVHQSQARESNSNAKMVRGKNASHSPYSNANLNTDLTMCVNPVINKERTDLSETEEPSAVSAEFLIRKQEPESRCSISECSDASSSYFSSLETTSAGPAASPVISSPEVSRPLVWDRLQSDPEEIASRGKAFFDHRLKKAEAMKVKWSSSLELDRGNSPVQQSSATSHFHEKMGRLILDLSGLSSQDSALFNQLLTLNNSINTLREQCLPLDGSISDDALSLSSLSEEEDTDSDHCTRRLYSPTSTLSSNSSAGSSFHSKRPTQRRLSQGSFVRQRVSYPPTAKNRLSRDGVRTTSRPSRPKVRRTSQEVFV